MPRKTGKVISVCVDEELHKVLQELARDQLRTPANFIAQYLAMTLQSWDKDLLYAKMNPGLMSNLSQLGTSEGSRFKRIRDKIDAA